MSIWRVKPVSAFEADMKKSELKKVLGKWSLTAIGVGAIIGGGIFVLTGTGDINIEEKFNECLDISGVGLSKLTTGLFWINPEKFMPIAGPVISHLKRKFPNFEHENEKGAKAWDKIFKGMKWEQYNIVLDYLKDDEENHLNVKKSFKELSLESIESSVENEILENKNIIFHGAPGTGKT